MSLRAWWWNESNSIHVFINSGEVQLALACLRRRGFHRLPRHKFWSQSWWHWRSWKFCRAIVKHFQETSRQLDEARGKFAFYKLVLAKVVYIWTDSLSIAPGKSVLCSRSPLRCFAYVITVFRIRHHTHTSWQNFGGAASRRAAVGGGILNIYARNVTIDGVVSARGQDGVIVMDAGRRRNGGGGAGGSVYIKVEEHFKGSGTVHADGGKGTQHYWYKMLCC